MTEWEQSLNNVIELAKDGAKQVLEDRRKKEADVWNRFRDCLIEKLEECFADEADEIVGMTYKFFFSTPYNPLSTSQQRTFSEFMHKNGFESSTEKSCAVFYRPPTQK